MPKLNFNATTTEPMEERSFELIPEDKYLATIIKTELVPTKDKKGERLNLQFKISQGEYKGNMVFVGLNHKNKNEQAVAISDRELKSICDAVGKGNEILEDSDDLKGIEIEITVVHSAPSGEYQENGETKYKYKPKAEIKGYKVASESDLYDKASDTVVTKSAPPWKKD